MNSRLLETLAQAGKATVAWTTPEGGSVLVLPHGGRILGLFAPESDRNFFWTNPALDSVDSARAFFHGDAWQNSGGDRTWFAPEIDFFFAHFPDTAVYRPPREFDPGNYQLTRDGDNLVLSNRFLRELSRSRRTVELEVSKRLGPARNPLRHLDLAKSLRYVGYTLRTNAAFAGGEMASVPVGLWSLLQLPHGGEMLVPTLSKAAITIYFGKIDIDDLPVTEHLIRYRMRAPGLHKIGVLPIYTIGRAGYLYSDGPESCLVVRNFQINPSGEYVDAPWGDAGVGTAGCAIQACNVKNEVGVFSELEYHAPAIGGRGNGQACEDESQVWAFRGQPDDIQQAARLLISSG